MYRLIFFLFMVFGCNVFHAQIPFSAIHQLPVLQNTSYAGSQNQKRIVMAYHHSKENSSLLTSQYLSYDDFWARKRIGFALHILNSIGKESPNLHNMQSFKGLFKHEIFEAEHQLKNTQRMFGFCISPKYNLFHKNNPFMARYTLSPSFGMDISSQHQIFYDNFNSRIAKEVNGDSINYFTDSLDFTESKAQATQFKINMGLKLSSKKLILSYLFSYSYYFAKETYISHQGSLYLNQISTQTSVLKHKITTYSHWITCAYSFSSKDNPKNNFSLFGGVGLRQFLDKDNYTNTNRKYYSLYLKDKVALNLLSQYYISGLYRHKKTLVGSTISSFDNMKFYGLNLGYKNSFFKLLTTFNFLPQSRNTAEIAVSFWIK